MSDRDRVLILEQKIAALEERLGPVAEPDRILPDQLYTPAQVSEYLNCGKSNVYDLIHSGTLARTSVGAGSKGIRVRGSDLLAFLDSRRQGGPAPQGSFKYLSKYLGA